MACETSDWVIEAFIDAWRPALGNSPAVRYSRDARRWREAADRLLERLEPQRIAAGFAQMVIDPYIGGKATTLPEFDRIAEEYEPIDSVECTQQRVQRLGAAQHVAP